MNQTGTSSDTYRIERDGTVHHVHRFIEMRHYDEDPAWDNLPTGFLICNGCATVIAEDCDTP